MGELSKKAIEIAITQIGEEEKPRGSNWGHPVSDYLTIVGINFPASWCMAFVQWCLYEAAKDLGLKVIPIFKSGGVLNVYNHTDKFLISQIPEAGNIFIQDHGHGLGHTGFVESVDGEFINTIEGNTNDSGSREGYEVCRRKRKISSCKAFIKV